MKNFLFAIIDQVTLLICQIPSNKRQTPNLFPNKQIQSRININSSIASFSSQAQIDWIILFVTGHDHPSFTRRCSPYTPSISREGERRQDNPRVIPSPADNEHAVVCPAQVKPSSVWPILRIPYTCVRVYFAGGRILELLYMYRYICARKSTDNKENVVCGCAPIKVVCAAVAYSVLLIFCNGFFFFFGRG